MMTEQVKIGVAEVEDVRLKLYRYKGNIKCKHLNPEKCSDEQNGAKCLMSRNSEKFQRYKLINIRFSSNVVTTTITAYSQHR